MYATVCFSIAHQNSSIDDLEILRFSSLQDCQQTLDIQSLVLIQTCNRTEIVTVVNIDSYSSLQNKLAKWIKLCLGRSKKIGTWYMGDDCLKHLLALCAGIESQAIGETQILSQVKEAVKESKRAGTLGTMAAIFDYAFHFAKRARHQTGIGHGATSLISLAFKVAKQVFQDPSTKSLCIVGAGEMSRLALQTAVSHNIRDITIANRSLENAFKLAQRYSTKAVGLNQLEETLKHNDLVITAIESTHYIITTEIMQRIMKARKNKLTLMIDLGLPRAIEHSADAISNLYIYDLEKLSTIRDDEIEKKQVISERIRLFIDSAITQWNNKKNERSTCMLVAAYREKLERYKEIELEKALRRLKNHSDPITTLNFLANNLTQKLAHPGTKIISKLESDHAQHNLIEEVQNIIDTDRVEDDSFNSHK